MSKLIETPDLLLILSRIGFLPPEVEALPVPVSTTYAYSIRFFTTAETVALLIPVL